MQTSGNQSWVEGRLANESWEKELGLDTKNNNNVFQGPPEWARKLAQTLWLKSRGFVVDKCVQYVEGGGQTDFDETHVANSDMRFRAICRIGLSRGAIYIFPRWRYCDGLVQATRSCEHFVIRNSECFAFQ